MRDTPSLVAHIRTFGALPFVATTTAYLAIVFGWLFLSVAGLSALVGIVLSILVGMVIAHGRQGGTATDKTSVLEASLELAGDREVFDRSRLLSESLLRISRQQDSIFRQIALEHLDELVRRAGQIADGTFVFEGTETWRIVYERLLRSPGLHLYRSVAWVKNANYWQDEPSRKSMAVNFELHDSERLNIERIAIIADELWPVGEVCPPITMSKPRCSRRWKKFDCASRTTSGSDKRIRLGSIFPSLNSSSAPLAQPLRTARFFFRRANPTGPG